MDLEARSRRNPTVEAKERLWQESVRRYHARRREHNQAEWYAFEMYMSELHARLSREHEAKAQALLTGGGG